MVFTKEQIKTIKLYCRIDNTVEDNLLENLIDSASMEITKAIDDKAEPEDFSSDNRFFVAVMKQTAEDYDYRGLGSDTMRFPLADPILNIVHQLRLERIGDESENT